ncbi:MAG: hypothetical protein GU346_06615 [Thermocrinis sp.]|nr:hypothetical protein [Thermocrinis sp.]
MEGVWDRVRYSKGLVPLSAGGRPDEGFLEQPHSPTFRESAPKSEEFLTEKDITLGYIYTVSSLIKRLLKEEGL